MRFVLSVIIEILLLWKESVSVNNFILKKTKHVNLVYHIVNNVIFQLSIVRNAKNQIYTVLKIEFYSLSKHFTQLKKDFIIL